jgi:ribosomal protein S18 acetylase RimI-like enzyme
MIRCVTPDDESALLSMTHDTGFFKPMEIDTLREVLRDFHAVAQAQGERCFVREEDGKIVGFVYYAPEPMTEGAWSLWWIVVRSGTQGKGLGGALLQFVEEDVRGHGARVLFVETSGLPHYEITQRFYLKHGYEEEARLRDYYADGDDQVVFRKRLTG